MARKGISPSGVVSVGPYTPAIESGGFIFLSGQTPIDPETGKLVTGGITEQTEQSFRNCVRVLEGAGLTCDDVVKVTVFLSDMSNFSLMNDVYAVQFSNPFPARSTVGVRELPLGALIEIEMIACRNGSR